MDILLVFSFHPWGCVGWKNTNIDQAVFPQTKKKPCYPLHLQNTLKTKLLPHKRTIFSGFTFFSFIFFWIIKKSWTKVIHQGNLFSRHSYSLSLWWFMVTVAGKSKSIYLIHRGLWYDVRSHWSMDFSVTFLIKYCWF